MGMMSKQDMDVNVKVLMDKVEFIMQAFSIGNPNDPYGLPKTLLDVYRDVQAGKSLSVAVGNDEVAASPDEPGLVVVNVEDSDVSVAEG